MLWDPCTMSSHHTPWVVGGGVRGEGGEGEGGGGERGREEEGEEEGGEKEGRGERGREPTMYVTHPTAMAQGGHNCCLREASLGVGEG